MNLVKAIEQEQLRRTSRTSARAIRCESTSRSIEGGKERLQPFEGVVITKRNEGLRSTFTVRKISHSIGVERSFMLHSPRIDRIEVLRRRPRPPGQALLSPRESRPRRPHQGSAQPQVDAVLLEGLRGWLATLPDWLANISIKWVLVAVGILLVLRMSMARGRPAARQASDLASEFLESALIAIVLVFLVIRPCRCPGILHPLQQHGTDAADRGPDPGQQVHLPVHETGSRRGGGLPAPLEASRGIGISLSGNGRDQEQKDFIKRIIGLPGDTIEVIPTRVLVDGSRW